MAIISRQFWALCPVWGPCVLVAEGAEHLGQQGRQGANQGRVGENLQECAKERDQAHVFLSLSHLCRQFVV